MKILVLGSEGQLGKCLQDQYSNSREDILFYSKKELDITNSMAVERVITSEQPKFIINASAYTAVDDAEDNKELANTINHLAVKSLSKQCFLKNIILLHVSTDYVFDGSSQNPYTEKCLTNPVTEYGKSKLKGEKSIIKSNCRHIIIRSAWIFSEHGTNFFKTMLNLANSNKELSVVNDQIGAPTYAQDLAILIKEIILYLEEDYDFKNWGIYNYCGDKECSWFNFTEHIFLEAKKYGIKTPKKYCLYQVLLTRLEQ